MYSFHIEYSLEESPEYWSRILSKAFRPNLRQTYEWRDLRLKTREDVSPQARFLKVYDQTGRIVAIMLYFRQGGMFKEFCIQGGPVSIDELRSPIIYRKIVDFILRQTKKEGIGRIVWYPDIFWNLPDIHVSPFKKSIPNRFILDLRRTEDSLWKNLGKKCRNAIRKAQREGIEITEDHDINNLKEFYCLHLQTANRVGFNPPPFSNFNLYWSILKPKGMLRLLTAKYKGKAVASALFFVYAGRVEYDSAASSSKYLHLRPNNLLLWRMIEIAQRERLEVFDFRGVFKDRRQIGIYKFKESFGGKLFPVPKYYYASRTCRLSSFFSHNLCRLIGVRKRASC